MLGGYHLPELCEILSELFKSINSDEYTKWKDPDKDFAVLYTVVLKKNNMAIFDWLHEIDCPKSWKTVLFAVENKMSIKFVEKLIDHYKFPINNFNVINTVARMSDLDLLKLFHSRGCPWHIDTCANLAYVGS